MKMTLAGVAEALGASLSPAAAAARDVSGYSIDTRTLRPGALFFAIVGPNHDAHRFVPEAFARGAVAAVVHAELAVPAGGPLLRVADTTRALQDLAAHVRRALPARIVAVTGSAGKTTTRAMAERCAATLGPTLGSPGNLNNLYGLPLALLALEPRHRTAVLEAGMSRPGELARLAEISDPDVGVLTNVGPAHLEYFGTLEKIASAKEELFAGMRPEATAVMNADDARVMAIGGRFARRGGRVLSFGLERPADVRGEEVRIGEEGTRARVIHAGDGAELRLRFHGAHYLMNALAAIGAGLALGGFLPALCKALARAEPLEQRGNLLTLPGKLRVLNDCYNSNPPALEQALRALLQIATRGRRIVVAGDMLELGPLESEAHRAAGERVARSGVEIFYGVGPRMAAAVEAARLAGMTAAHHAPDAEAAAALVEREVRPGDTLLVKGSRGVHLEKVIEALQKAHART